MVKMNPPATLSHEPFEMQDRGDMIPSSTPLRVFFVRIAGPPASNRNENVASFHLQNYTSCLSTRELQNQLERTVALRFGSYPQERPAQMGAPSRSYSSSGPTDL